LPSTPTGSRSARRHVGVRFLDYLEAAVRIAGAHKILFGSDGPLLHPGLELCKIRLLELNPEEEALILGGRQKTLAALDAAREEQWVWGARRN